MFEIYAKKKENHPKTVKELSVINDPPGNIEGKMFLEAPVSTMWNLL